MSNQDLKSPKPIAKSAHAVKGTEPDNNHSAAIHSPSEREQFFSPPGTPRMPIDANHLDLVTARLQRMSRRWMNPVRKDHRDAQKRVSELFVNKRWNYSEIARNKTGETTARAEMKPRFMPNLLRQIVTPLTYLYDTPPKRVPCDVADMELDAEAAQEMTQEHWMSKALWNFQDKGRWDYYMNEIDRLVRLHGTVWVQLIWRSKADTAAYYAEIMEQDSITVIEGEDGFDLLILNPCFFEIIPSPCDPTTPEAVVLFPSYDEYEIVLQNFDPVAGSHPGIYWDNKCMAYTRGFQLVSLDNGESVQPHALGFIPGCVVRNEPDTRQFWVWGVGGYQITDDLWDIAQLWREYIFTSMCSRGQYWADGEPQAGKGALGPDQLIILKNGKTFGSVGLNADLEGMRDSINSTCEAWARSNNVPASLIRLEEKTQAVSGRAMILQSAELEDDYPKRVQTFTKCELQLHRLAAAILTSIHGKTYDGELAELCFAKYQPKLQHTEMMAELAFERDSLGMDDLYILRRLHPDQDDATLQAWLDERPVREVQPTDDPNASQIEADNARTSDRTSPSARTSDRPGTAEPGVHTGGSDT